MQIDDEQVADGRAEAVEVYMYYWDNRDGCVGSMRGITKLLVTPVRIFSFKLCDAKAII